VSELQREIVQFASRWVSLRPKDGGDFSVEITSRIMTELATWRKEFGDLEDRCGKMQTQCQQFSVNCPPFDDLTRLDNGIRVFEEVWGFCAEFVDALHKMETELWINMRTHLYDVEDFVNAYSKKLRVRAQQAVAAASQTDKETAQGTAVITEFMTNKLNDLRSVFPLLKLVTGEMFEKEHWTFLFHKLKFASDVGVHTLTLASFVRASPLIVANAPALRDLAARAQGEITLREALAELRAWCDSAEFKSTKERFGAQQVCLCLEMHLLFDFSPERSHSLSQ
jgi:dynein heavy chain 2